MKYLERVIVLLVVLTSPMVVVAQTPTSWEPLQGEGNAKITSVATTPATKSMAIVGYDNGDVFLGFGADTETPNWTQVDDRTGTPFPSLPNGPVTAVAISSYDTQTYYVAFAGCHYPDKLWKTSTGGEFFVSLENAPFCDISSIAVNPVDSSVIYVIADGELWVSDDYGSNWTQDEIVEPILPPLAEGDRISAISSARNNFYSRDELILVGTVQGDVWLTLQGGDNWIRLDEPANPSRPDLPNSIVTSVVVDDRYAPPFLYVSFYKDELPDDRDAIWVSGNGGEAFGNIYGDNMPSNSGVGMLSVNPAYLVVLYATTTTSSTFINAYKSEDNGLTWNDGCTCDTGCNNALTAAISYFGTTGPVCFAINDDIEGWTSWNTEGRDIVVNGLIVENGEALPAKINDRYYVYFTDGDRDYTGWMTW